MVAFPTLNFKWEIVQGADEWADRANPYAWLAQKGLLLS